MNSEDIRDDERNKIADWMINQADNYLAINQKNRYGNPEANAERQHYSDELYRVARRLRSGPVGEQNCQHCGAPSGISSECKPCLRRIIGMSPR